MGDQSTKKEYYTVYIGNLKIEKSKDELRRGLCTFFNAYLKIGLKTDDIKMKGGNKKKYSFIHLQSKDDQDKAIDILKSTESHPKLKSEFLLLVEPDQIIKFSVKNQDVDDKLQNTCTENVTITRNSVLNLANDDRGNKSELTWHYKEDAYLGNENRNKEFKHGGGDYIEKTLKKDVSKYLCGFLNSLETGTLYIGVADTGFVKGIECDHKREDTIRIRIDESVKTFIPTLFTKQYHVYFIPVYTKNGTLKDNFKVLQITVDKVDNLKQLYQADGKAYMRRDGSVEVLDPSDIQAWCKQQQSLPYYGLSQPALGQSEYGLSQSGLGQSTFSQNSLFLPTTPTPDTYQQLSYQRNQLPTHVPPFGQPQPNTIMVSSATSSLMSTSIKPRNQSKYGTTMQKNITPNSLSFGQNINNSSLQPFPNQLFGANALLIATQTQQKNASSQLLGSQLVHPRPAVQIVQQVQGNSSFNQQPPQQQMQQTCFSSQPNTSNFQKKNNITEDNSIERNKMADVSLAVMGNTVPVVEDGKSSNLLAKLDEIKEEFFRLEVENRSLHEIIQSEKQRETEVLNKVIQSKNDDMIRYANKIDEESARKEAIISSLKEEKEKSSADGKKTATGIKKLSGD